MARSGEAKARYQYQLLATSKTSTMQKELNRAAEAGFDYCGQTVFDPLFGGKEMGGIRDRCREQPACGGRHGPLEGDVGVHGPADVEQESGAALLVALFLRPVPPVPPPGGMARQPGEAG